MFAKPENQNTHPVRTPSLFPALWLVTCTCTAVVLLFAIAGALSAADPDTDLPVLVEAEGFADTGGWVIDPQFMDLMGSPYRHDADGDGLDEIHAISFLPSPSKRTWSNEHNGGSWSHAMPGGHEGIRRQIDLDGNGCADFIMPFGAWHWGSDSILFLMEGGTNK